MKTEIYPCGNCSHPVITSWSKEGLEPGDYLLLGEVFFHKGKCANDYIDEFNLAITAKGKNMNEILENMVEVLDENGNPTGQYEVIEKETYITTDSKDHII